MVYRGSGIDSSSAFEGGETTGADIVSGGTGCDTADAASEDGTSNAFGKKLLARSRASVIP